MRSSSNCESCVFYVFDEEYGYYVCEADLDEDEMLHFLRGTSQMCASYRWNDDYKIVRKQM